MNRIVAIANPKGGVGKTTTAINLSAGLGELNKKILAIDFDPQGGLSTGLGVDIDGLELTIYNALFDKSVSLDKTILNTSIKNIDLVPANIDLSMAEVLLLNKMARETFLKKKIEPLRNKYDFIFVDCPPSLGQLTINALIAADKIIIPVQCSFLAMRGLKQMIDIIEEVKESLNPELQIAGILLTQFDSRTLHAREVIQRVREAFRDKVYKTIIVRTVRFDEAPVKGRPILEYASNSKGAECYRNLSKEVLKNA